MNRKNAILGYCVVISAALLLALNYHIFIVLNHFAPAGLNGIATMVQYKTGFSISYMSLLINVPLCTAAYFVMDKEFALKTLVFSLVYSFAYLFLQNTDTAYLQYNAGGHDTIYPVILSGVISGFVYGLCFRNNACTGGTDVVSRYINKIKPNSNFFVVTFGINVAVAVVSLFVYSEGSLNYKPVALCIAYCCISNFVGNHIIKGTRNAFKFTVITTHPDEIGEELTRVIRHGVTRLEGTGVYSKLDKAVLFCVINRHQLADFREIIEKYDNTFSFCESVNETYGNFKKIK
ncbi:MAG: YitT family protein [Oscillospiraceae bacterium]|nr:YitT family protein [Oscillospiraceae bacterium]